MPPKQRPTLIFLAGPNGAGKSTLYESRIAPNFGAPFINADIIQRDELKTEEPKAAYKAAEIAAHRRRDLLQQKKSFVTESVFSHPSKLDLIFKAKNAGYRLITYHVGVGIADLSVARVEERVKEGGHAVPEEKIRARFDRNGPLIREAVLLSDTAHVYDNSRLNRPPQRMLSFRAGRLSFVRDRLPDWILEIYQKDLNSG